MPRPLMETSGSSNSWLARAGLRLSGWFEQWFPDAFALAVVAVVIVFTAAVYPGGTTTDTLVPRDTIRTTSGGLAVVQVRYTGGARPDSIVITATARHHDGSIVPGSPITFVVGFLP